MKEKIGYRQTSRESLKAPGETTPITGLSLRRNFSWTLAGSAIYSVCQWGMLVVIARLGTPEKVGRFALAFAVTGPVVVFLNLQLRVVQATDAKYEFSFGHYLALRLVTTLIALLVIISITVVLPYQAETSMVILAVGAAKLIESISDVIHGFLQQHERMDRIAVSLIIRGTLSLLALGTGIYLTSSVFWGVVGMAAVWTLVLFTYDIRSGLFVLRNIKLPGKPTDMLRPCWNYPALKKLAVLSYPLGLTMMLVSLNANVPRYFIEHYQGEKELGIFAAMIYLMAAGNVVVNALAHSAAPRLARHFTDSDARAYRSLLLKLVGFGSLTGIAGVLVCLFFGRWILTVLYGAEYAGQSSLLAWLAFVSWMSYIQSFFFYGMTAARCFRVQVPLLALATGVTALICFLLVPSLGMSGTVWAMLASTMVLVIGSLAVNIQMLRRLERKEASENYA